MHLTFPSAQVEFLEHVDSKLEEGNEDALRERLHHIAALENPSGTVKSICRRKYSRRGQQKVKVDAAVTVSFPNDQPPLAYVAERKQTLTLTAFDEVEDKWSMIRWVPMSVVCACCASLRVAIAKPSRVCLTKRPGTKASIRRLKQTSCGARLLSPCLLVTYSQCLLVTYSQCQDVLTTQ